jgi:peptidyl-tRNA hydrolase, PTH2 family
MPLKQAILVRNDLKLPKGKLAAQAAHASVEATLRSEKDKVKEWRMEGMGKIVLKVEDKKELFKYLQMAKDAGLVAALITDAGKTVVAPGTDTCLAIGPDEEESIDSITGKLKLL